MGNHDYVPIKIVRKIYKDANIPIWDNQYKTVEVNKKKIVIFGLKDFWHYKEIILKQLKKYFLFR